MPALFATCQACSYEFTFDYDFRQGRCSKCSAKFDWVTNPKEGKSFHAELGSDSADYSKSSGPKLPGEPGYEEYTQLVNEKGVRYEEL